MQGTYVEFSDFNRASTHKVRPSLRQNFISLASKLASRQPCERDIEIFRTAVETVEQASVGNDLIRLAKEQGFRFRSTEISKTNELSNHTDAGALYIPSQKAVVIDTHCSTLEMPSLIGHELSHGRQIVNMEAEFGVSGDLALNPPTYADRGFRSLVMEADAHVNELIIRYQLHQAGIPEPWADYKATTSFNQTVTNLESNIQIGIKPDSDEMKKSLFLCWMDSRMRSMYEERYLKSFGTERLEGGSRTDSDISLECITASNNKKSYVSGIDLSPYTGIWDRISSQDDVKLFSERAWAINAITTTADFCSDALSYYEKSLSTSSCISLKKKKELEKTVLRFPDLLSDLESWGNGIPNIAETVENFKERAECLIAKDPSLATFLRGSDDNTPATVRIKLAQRASATKMSP